MLTQSLSRSSKLAELFGDAGVWIGRTQTMTRRLALAAKPVADKFETKLLLIVSPSAPALATSNR